MNSIISRFVAMWARPFGVMNDVKMEGEDASIKPYIVFIVVMGLVSGLISAIEGMFVPGAAAAAGGSKATVWLAVLVMPLVSFVGSFIAAFLIWWLTDGVLQGTKSQYKTAYRILAVLAAFTPIATLLGPIPKVGQYLAIAVNLWATIVMIKGIIIVRETPPVRTWVTCGILFIMLFVLGIFARVAAQRQLAGGPAGFGEFGGEPADELGATSDELEKQLQDLANKATTDQPAQTAPKK